MASWVLAFNKRARAAIGRLDTWLQEEILDELDLLAQDPGQLRRAGSTPACIADLTSDRENQRHYVFPSIEINTATRTLEVVDIAHYSRSI